MGKAQRGLCSAPLSEIRGSLCRLMAMTLTQGTSVSELEGTTPASRAFPSAGSLTSPVPSPSTKVWLSTLLQPPALSWAWPCGGQSRGHFVWVEGTSRTLASLALHTNSPASPNQACFSATIHAVACGLPCLSPLGPGGPQMWTACPHMGSQEADEKRRQIHFSLEEEVPAA